MVKKINYKGKKYTLDREDTIATVLTFISQIDNINDMRHHILKVVEKLEDKKYEIVLKK